MLARVHDSAHVTQSIAQCPTCTLARVALNPAQAAVSTLRLLAPPLKRWNVDSTGALPVCKYEGFDRIASFICESTGYIVLAGSRFNSALEVALALVSGDAMALPVRSHHCVSSVGAAAGTNNWKMTPANCRGRCAARGLCRRRCRGRLCGRGPERLVCKCVRQFEIDELIAGRRRNKLKVNFYSQGYTANSCSSRFPPISMSTKRARLHNST
jgi:hypothetical protein